MNFIHPMSCLLPRIIHAILLLIVELTVKPGSIILGIITTLILLGEEDFIKEFKK